MACNCNPPRFHSMNCSVRETLCRGDLFHYGAPPPAPLPIIAHSVLFHSAALIMLRLFAGACRLSLSLSLSLSLPPRPIIPSANSVVLNSGDTGKKNKGKSTMRLICQTRDAEKMCSKSAANNVQSKIIKLPVWQWLIFTNIWQDRFFFVLWVCFGSRSWCLSGHHTNVCPPKHYVNIDKLGLIKQPGYHYTSVGITLFIICRVWSFKSVRLSREPIFAWT